jgi:hypothetical protein
VVSAADPLRSLISVFWTVAATLLSNSSSFILTRAEWNPFQTHCFSGNLLAPGIEPWTSGTAVRNPDHETTKMLGNYRVAAEVLVSRAVFSSTELVN